MSQMAVRLATNECVSVESASYKMLLLLLLLIERHLLLMPPELSGDPGFHP